MTPKEKANQLLFKFNPKGVYWVYDNISFNGGHNYEPINRRLSFDCMNPLIIAVDEIIEALKDNASNSASWLYWENVKQEIEKL